MPIERLLDSTDSPLDPPDLYASIRFPEAPDDRPYVFVNMASTVDGKIVLKEHGGTAAGIGGPTDQLLFRRLQKSAEGALIGGGTLRASQVIYPPDVTRFAATRSGDLPLQNRFFRDAPDRAYVVIPEDMARAERDRLHAATNVIEAGKGDVDLRAVLRTMRREMKLRTLLCEGGAQLNDQLIRLGLVDELFLTLSPKLKGGARLPTIMTGDGFAPDMALPMALISVYHDGDEIYLRYRLGRTAQLHGASRSKSQPNV
jgi:riboflavin biosynthesis pyrimidine reductase